MGYWIHIIMQNIYFTGTVNNELTVRNSHHYNKAENAAGQLRNRNEHSIKISEPTNNH